MLANLVEFAQVFNGFWWSESVVHYCRRDGACCVGRTDSERRQEACRKAAKCIRQVLLRRKPKKAAENKWTKLGPSFDFWGPGFFVHNILPDLVTASVEGRVAHSFSLDRPPCVCPRM